MPLSQTQLIGSGMGKGDTRHLLSGLGTAHKVEWEGTKRSLAGVLSPRVASSE